MGSVRPGSEICTYLSILPYPDSHRRLPFLIDRYEQDSTVFGEQFYWQLLSDLTKAYMNIGKEKRPGSKERWRSCG